MEHISNRFRVFWLWLPLALVVSACGDSDQGMSEPVSRPVKLFTVGETPPPRTLKFPGSVSAVQQSELAFEVSGRIIAMPVTEGDRVEVGTILAKLDPRDYESERDRARAERNAARADFNRYDKAFQSDAVTAQQLDLAKRAIEVAEAGLQRANKALEDTVMQAPFSGRVARKLVEDYANVQAKQPVMILQSDDALEMKVNIPEADWVGHKPVTSAAELEQDADIKVALSSLPNRAIPARITAFSTSADPVTRTFEVTVGFEPPKDLSVSPGMTGHVAYTHTQETALEGLAIPARAVVSAPDKSPFVWLFDSEAGTITKRGVEIGELTGDSIQVVSGLETGDRIAVSGVHTLSEGFPVHALED